MILSFGGEYRKLRSAFTNNPVTRVGFLNNVGREPGMVRKILSSLIAETTWSSRLLAGIPYQVSDQSPCVCWKYPHLNTNFHKEMFYM